MNEDLSVARRFGERLRYYRSLQRLTQSGLAEKVGLSLKQISRIERGLSTPSFALLEKLCRALDIAPVTLFLFHDPSPPQNCSELPPASIQEPTAAISNNEIISTRIGAWFLPSSSRHGTWSASLYTLLGYRPFSVKPTLKRFLKHVRSMDRAAVESFIHSSAQDPNERGILVPLTGKGPVQRMIMVQAEPLGFETDNENGLLVTVREVTDCISLHRSFVHNQRQQETYMLERNKELALTVERLQQEILERNKAEQGLRISDLMIAGSLDAQIFVDRSGLVKKVNPAYARLAGISLRKLEGRLYNDMLIERWGRDFFDRAILPDMEKAQTHGQAKIKEGWFSYGRLGRRYMRVFLTPCLKNKEILGVIVTLHDLTAVMAAQERLRQSEEQHRLILETANEGVLRLDRHLRIMFANARIQKLGGRSAAELLGGSALDFIAPEETGRIQFFAEQNRAGHSVRFPASIIHKNGQIIWVMISAAPLFTDAGEYDGALVMLMNVTELKQTAAKLE
ncbi:PAS domain S-box protein [Desulfonatronum lacustre]|uniref:PAS domain S-box protein n=1 Tax=Desulfonatronum lacustre TaxID=66849 RepID=UPI00048F7712|nr:PAS domain S-box protein [Desulfonatronum lacustre]